MHALTTAPRPPPSPQVRRLDAEVLQLTKELAEARQRSDEDAEQWYQKEKAYVAEASAMRFKLTKVEAELRQSRDETSDQQTVFEAMVSRVPLRWPLSPL